MKKLKISRKVKYLIIISILLTFIISLSIIIKFRNSFNSQKNQSEEFYPYQYFQNITNIQNYFLNRQILVKKESNEILIGRNKKELENGYYDIKFNLNKDNACVRINNLQKQDINFRSISNEYLDELKLFLHYLLNNEDVDVLINIIREEYIKLRSSDECIVSKNAFRQISINKYTIIFNVENNVLKVDIKV